MGEGQHQPQPAATLKHHQDTAGLDRCGEAFELRRLRRCLARAAPNTDPGLPLATGIAIEVTARLTTPSPCNYCLLAARIDFAMIEMDFPHWYNPAIPEDACEHDLAFSIDEKRDRTEYSLDLGSGALESSCPTPALSRQSSFGSLRRPVALRAFGPPRSLVGSGKGNERREREAERDCGLCFELAVAPVRTHCCSQLICGEHIVSYLADPRADGHCPVCRAPPPAFTYASLGHLATVKDAPPPPPPSRAPSPSVDGPVTISPMRSAAPYASYPSLPVRVLPTRRSGARRRTAAPSSPLSTSVRSSSLASATSSSSSSSQATHTDDNDGWYDDLSALDEDDDTLLTATHDAWTLSLLVRARALQTRRHASHSFTTVVGVRGVLVALLRVLVWVGVVWVLARAGRWGDEDGDWHA
uniref:RING-type domain-containing protein n=1 Tax=Mycena chlorophos TaxID=658473 RepID=A0ABQ0KZ50_MYCCL|nr:predicted protein [Mycena chlorophos]